MLLLPALTFSKVQAAPYKIEPLGIVGGRIIGGADFTPMQYLFDSYDVGADRPGMAMNGLGQVVEDIGIDGTSLLWLPAPAYGLSAGYHYLPAGFKAQRIGPAGHVVGIMTSDQTAAIWYGGGLTNLGKLGLDGVVSLDVTFRGVVLGTAYRLNPAGTPHYLGTAVIAQPGSNQLQPLFPGGTDSTWAFRANFNADVVGYDTSANQTFVTRNGTGLQPGARSYITELPNIVGNNINAFGDIAGIQTSPTVKTIFAYAPSGQNDLPGSPTVLVNSNAPAADVVAINSRGQVLCVVSYASYLYQHGTLTHLTNLIPNNSGWRDLVGADLNDNGWIIGEGTLNGQIDQAFLMVP
ncbi:MAG TPA: hypothetical protein VHI52_02820, partial [Verrucomicrobiae bacterium]|nr:hypothetical protein [Verrucomicrobiae bacterium]